MISFEFKGYDLSASDFPRDLRGWVAFSIAFASATGCSDKDSQIELLLHEADSIIRQVQEGRAPEC